MDFDGTALWSIINITSVIEIEIIKNIHRDWRTKLISK